MLVYWKEILGLLAVACEVVSAIYYYRDIYDGNTKPHLYTMLVWAIVTGIAFAGALVGGGEAGTWGTFVSFIFMVSLVPVTYYLGTTDITWHDRCFLVGALLSIVPWLATNDPLWSVIFATLIDALGMLPTLRKTWNAPYSESLPAWYLAAARSAFQLCALAIYSPTTLIYLIEVLAADLTLIGIILVRRRATRIPL